MSDTQKQDSERTRRTSAVSDFGSERVAFRMTSAASLLFGYSTREPSQRSSVVLSSAISSTCDVI